MSLLLAVWKQRAVVWLTTVILVLLGALSARSLPSGIYPEVEFPRIVVVARTGGAPSDVFLTSVTRPLEQALASVVGIQRIRSKTIRGATEIGLSFAPDTDMWRALQLVESRVAEARSGLPPDAELVVEKVTTGSFPVLTLNISGLSDPRELRELAEFVVRPALASVPGVGRTDVLGGDVREVEVVADPEAMAGLHLSPTQLADRLRTALSLSAVGRLERDRQLVTVLGDAQPRSLAELRALPVLVTAAGGVLPLSAVAQVSDGAEDRAVRVGGPRGETVMISVARLPGASTPDVVDRALEAIAGLGPSLPRGARIEPVYDQASLVRESMSSVRDAILVGIALCAAIITLFLRDVRAGLFAAASVPITLAVTLLLMRVFHQTLNLMSLGGMAVAIGLVVDDAIVIMEAIMRHRESEPDAALAAEAGTRELAPAVIGTTFTTVVVFVPLAFLDGVVGDFFRALAFTLTSAVVCSLLVSLVLVPLAAGVGLSKGARRMAARGGRYRRVVGALIARPLVAVLLLAALVASGAASASRLGRGFLPTMDEGAFVLDYFLPSGTSLSETVEFARRLEDELRRTPEVQSFSRRTGAELGPAAATELSRGDIVVRLKARALRARSSDEVIADLRARIEPAMPEVRVEFVQVLQDVLNDLSGSPRPIELKLFGPDYARLHELGEGLAAELRKIPGLVDIYNGHDRDAPDLHFVARRDDAARLGITPDEVNAQLEAGLRGVRVGAMRRLDRLVGIRVRYPDSVRFDAARVLALPVAVGGRVTSLGAVTEPEFSVSPSSLLHEALQPMVSVTADREGRDLGVISDEVNAAVRALRLEQGYRVVVGGQIESQRASLNQLLGVGGVGLLLVLTVLAAQFRRLRLALLILGAVPAAMVGAVFALLVSSTPLNASSLMGSVLLVGLVVKNGVLLLEEAEKRLDGGLGADEAVLFACEQRLRPVLMTTLATLAGLLPLALGIGAGAELQKPLAVAVIGGLLSSTLVTLVLLPPIAAALLRR